MVASVSHRCFLGALKPEVFTLLMAGFQASRLPADVEQKTVEAQFTVLIWRLILL
jgi:hypothetical protein